MTIYEIAINAVSKVTGVSKSTIISPTRVWPAVEARQLIILLLSRDGMSDESISWVLKRGRIAILGSRHNANDLLSISKQFKSKYDKAKSIYDQQKSLLASEV